MTKVDDTVLFGISLILRSSGLSIPEPIRRKRLRNAIGLLTAVSTIVRLEIALFLLPIVLSLVVQQRISFSNALIYGAFSGLCGLGQSTQNTGQPLTDQLDQRPSIYTSGCLPSPIPTSHSTPGNN